MQSKNLARVGAAGFALGLYLGAPGLPVAAADTGQDDGAAVSSSAGEDAGRAAAAPGRARPAAGGQSRTSQRSERAAAPAAGVREAGARRAIRPAAAQAAAMRVCTVLIWSAIALMMARD